VIDVHLTKQGPDCFRVANRPSLFLILNDVRSVSSSDPTSAATIARRYHEGVRGICDVLHTCLPGQRRGGAPYPHPRSPPSARDVPYSHLMRMALARASACGAGRRERNRRSVSAVRLPCLTRSARRPVVRAKADAVSALKAARQAALACVGQAMAIFAPRSSQASLLSGTETQGRLRFFGATAPVVLGKSY
jgi:hypothetical protein